MYFYNEFYNDFFPFYLLF